MYICIKKSQGIFCRRNTAELSFRRASDAEINDYIKKNRVTAISCVGSYKIEENKKYKFIKILKGSKESIIGFPLKKFLGSIKKEK